MFLFKKKCLYQKLYFVRTMTKRDMSCGTAFSVTNIASDSPRN